MLRLNGKPTHMKSLKYQQLVILCIAFALCFNSCIISNTQPEDCEILTVKITAITDGGNADIVFHAANGDRYYINRGLERGLNLEDLNVAVLNKTVTLHLANMLGGTVTSEHISQLAVAEAIVFTEFN